MLISHDLAVVARLADRVAVMRDGEHRRAGPDVEQILTAPAARLHPDAARRGPAAAHPRAPAQHRIGAASRCRRPGRRPRGPDRPDAADLVKASAARRRHPARASTTSRFELSPAARPSASSASPAPARPPTARIALGLLEPDSGTVHLRGRHRGRRCPSGRGARAGGGCRSSTRTRSAPSTRARPWSGSSATRSPRRPARRRPPGPGRGAARNTSGSAPRTCDRRPLQLSGGQRQRVAIARALAPEPGRHRLRRAGLRARRLGPGPGPRPARRPAGRADGIAYLFISHDLGVIHHLADRVLVMKDGRVVEQGPGRGRLRRARSTRTPGPCSPHFPS